MTHLDIYRCDRKRCKASEPAVYPDLRGRQPPGGWLSLTTSRDGLGQGFDFCSLDCLAIWARAERAAL